MSLPHVREGQDEGSQGDQVRASQLEHVRTWRTLSKRDSIEFGSRPRPSLTPIRPHKPIPHVRRAGLGIREANYYLSGDDDVYVDLIDLLYGTKAICARECDWNAVSNGKTAPAHKSVEAFEIQVPQSADDIDKVL